MPTNLERASLVSRSVQIESVSLAKVAMNSDLGEESRSGVLQLSQRYRARYQLQPSDSRKVLVRVEFRFEAHCAGEGEPDRRVTDIEAEFLVVYRTNADSAFPADALQHFAGLNGTYNAWPYWRELVQSLMARTGMSGITVPVYTPKVRKVEVQKDLPVPRGSDDASLAPATALTTTTPNTPASGS